mgnify:CR=1 FL=1|jgi:hypothetical protein
MAFMSANAKAFFNFIDQGEVAKARELANTLPANEKKLALKILRNFKRDTLKSESKFAGKGLGAGNWSTLEKGWSVLQKVAPAMAVTTDRFDEMGASLTKLASTTRSQTSGMIANLTNLQRRNADLGFSTVDVHKGMEAALEGYAKVSGPAFAKDSMAITKQVVMYQKLGVSAGTTLGVFNKFEGVLGKTREASLKTSTVLNKFAQTTGQSYARVWQDFGSNVGQFMDILDSEQMTRQTLLFQTRARRMGLSVSEIMTPLQQFETLDSAQASAGKINAVMSSLGGSFDAIKAAGMDFPERMEYVSKSIQSVMGRVEASGPRASRAYTIALRKSFGLSATQFRAMASYKPGAASAGEMMMAEGRMKGMAPGETDAAVAAAATRTTLTAALKDSRESMMYIALPKAAGIVSTSVADALVKASSRFDQFGYNIAENLGGQLAKAVGGSIADVFKEGDMKKVKDGFFAMAQAVDRSRKCVSGPWGSADCK